MEVLDGMIALTNTGFGVFQTVVMSSNSTQVASIAAALNRSRLAQTGQVFRNVGDAFATPELSIASPWLGAGANWPTDAALEIIPSQFLSALRPDSRGSIFLVGSEYQLRFSGLDGYSYAVDTCSDLWSWTSISTNYTVSGLFTLPLPWSSGTRFFRTRLLP